MGSFFKYMFASALGFFLVLFICVLFFIIIAVGTISVFQKDELTSIDPNGILKIQLNYAIEERTTDDPFKNFDFNSFLPKKKLGLDKIILNIEKAAKDDKIKGIYLHLRIIPAKWATIEAVRNALIRFKESGKFIIAFSEVYTQKAYYLASLADEIYITPEGYFDFKGLEIELAFFKKTLDKLEIKPHVFYAGKYKSATEPVRFTQMSDENKKQMSVLLEDYYSHFLKNISLTRGSDVNMLDSIANNFLIRKAQDAVTFGLVDKLIYEDELQGIMQKKIALDSVAKLNVISMNKYNQTIRNYGHPLSKNKIAVVYAVGDIALGKSNEDNMGSTTITHAIRKARLNKNVKAIVLRVNSPGGFALAADLIWREVVLAQKEKPVVVSMGDYAASGGYYISCPADTIVAEPNTLTGSIGVFGLFLNTKDFFDHKLGITFDGVKTSKYADIGNPSRPISNAEKDIIQTEVDRIYEEFITRVSHGRKLDLSYVDSIAQGRVWTGTQARNIGLVDVIGGLNDAVKIAADMAGIETYKIQTLPKSKDFFVKMIEEFSTRLQDKFFNNEMGITFSNYLYLRKIIEMNSIQTRIPALINIR